MYIYIYIYIYAHSISFAVPIWNTSNRAVEGEAGRQWSGLSRRARDSKVT